MVFIAEINECVLRKERKPNTTVLRSFSFYQNINAPFIFSCFSVCVNDIIDVIQYSYGTEIHFTEAILWQIQ